MAIKNQPITICYVAWNTSTNAGQAADAANHTLKLVQDGTEAAPTNSPAEVDATNCPGLYKLALAAADMNFNCVAVGGKSGTANVSIIPVTIVTERGALPNAAAGATGGLPTVDAANGVKLSVGTGTGQVNVATGKVPATMGSADYSGNTVQTGDAFARIGATGSGLTSLATASALSSLTTTVGTPMQASSYAAPDNANIAATHTLLSALLATDTTQFSAHALALTPTGGAAANVNVIQWGGVAVATPSLAGVPVVDVHYSAGQSNASTAQAGTSTTITLSTDEPITDNIFTNQYIGIIGGTGAGQARLISGYSGPGRLVTVSRAWDQTPDSTSVYAIGGLGEVATVTGPVALDMTQAVPISNTVQTVGDALNAARAQGFGRWTIAGTTLTLYAADGTTVVRSFALDSATAPTSRS